MIEIAGGIVLVVVGFYVVAGIALVRSDRKQMRYETKRWRKELGL